jgi:hypothetical protein
MEVEKAFFNGRWYSEEDIRDRFARGSTKPLSRNDLVTQEDRYREHQQIAAVLGPLFGRDSTATQEDFERACQSLGVG